MPQDLPITQEGFDKLVKEIENLKKVERPAIIVLVAEARAQGDISENAEYHAAREKQSYIQTRIEYLEDVIARSRVIAADTPKPDTIVFGCKVKVKDIVDGEEDEYILVGAGEADPSCGKISTASPIGKALIGRKTNDIVQVTTPGGRCKLKILDFS
jgi:transcription elongation factor GreA